MSAGAARRLAGHLSAHLPGRLFGAAAAEEPEAFAAFVDDAVTREMLQRIAAERGWAESAVQEGGIAAAVRTLAVLPPPKLLVVDLSRSQDVAADTATLAELLEETTRTVALGTVNDIALFRRLIEAGIADYLVKPVAVEPLKAALERAERKAEPAGAAAREGRLVLLTGARGGVGASTLAANLAWLGAHELKARIALVDLDLHFGTLALALDLEPGRGLREALERPDRVDELFIERAMAKASDNLFVLGAEEPLEDQPCFDGLGLETLFGDLRAKFDCVIVDLPRGLLIARREILGQASAVVLVTDLSLAALRDTVRLQRLVKEQAPELRRVVVANRTDGHARGHLARADFEKGLEGKIHGLVPEDAKAAARAANLGKPLAEVARGSKTVKALRALAAGLIVPERAASKRARKTN